MRIFQYISFCLIIVFAPHVYGQNPAETYDLKDLESVVEHDMKTSGAPGAVIAVVQGEKIIYEKAFGLANTRTKRPVKTHTVFQAASVTKLLTALALLSVSEKEHIGLDTRIGTIIPELSTQVSKITIHQLLSHTSGIMDGWPNKSTGPEDVLRYFTEAGDNILFEEPGAVFSYSNSGFTLAGLVLARLTGTSYEQAVQDLIFSPLGMNHSTFDVNNAVIGPFANGHSFNTEQEEMIPTGFDLTDPTVRPAGGLFSNIDDMARLASALMNDGKFKGQQIFDGKTVRQLDTGISPFGIQYHYFGYSNSTYSYGSINFKYRGITFFGHSGEANSQNALFAIAPHHDTALIIFSNAGWYPFIKSFEKAVEIFLPVKDEKTTFSFESPDSKSIVGKYFCSDIEHPKSDWIEILSRNGILYVDFSSGGEYRLTQIGNLKYQFSHPSLKYPPEIKFLKDNKGNIKYLNYLWRVNVKER